MFNSDAKQDEFVANILQFKRGGFYLDIGGCSSMASNNSYFFESLSWDGICIEINSSYNQSYINRKCHYINGNALNIDYKELFINRNVPNEIDYLSIDIDELSYDVMIKLPFDNYTFKTITIEHDLYLHGDIYKKKQEKFLIDNGYYLLCENVFVEQTGYYGKSLPFENWWVNPKYFDINILNSIKCKNLLPSEIIPKIKSFYK